MARLDPPELRGLPVGPAEPVRAGGRVSAPERGEPDDRQMERRPEPELLLRERQGPLRLLAGELELAAMDGDPRDREVVLRHLDPVLDADLARAGGAVRRELPAPASSSTHASDQSRIALHGSSRSRHSWYSRSSTTRAASMSPSEMSSVGDRVGRRPQQLRVADGGRELVRPRRVRRRLRVAHDAAEQGELVERAGPERVVVELVGELECRTGVLERRRRSPS